MSPHRAADGPPARGGFARLALTIFWPAFVMAGVMDALIFVVVDPASLSWFGAQPVEASPSAVYTLGFLVCWGVIAISGAITCLLLLEPEAARR